VVKEAVTVDVAYGHHILDRIHLNSYRLLSSLSLSKSLLLSLFCCKHMGSESAVDCSKQCVCLALPIFEWTDGSGILYQSQYNDGIKLYSPDCN